MKTRIPRPNFPLLLATTMALGLSAFGDETWRGSTDNLWTTPGNWSGNASPGSADTVIYNNTSSQNLSNWLGGDFGIVGLVVSNVPGPVSINSDVNTLTLTPTSPAALPLAINMTNAAQNLTIVAAVAPGNNQSWNVATNRTLDVQGIVSGTGTIYKDGFGALYLSGTNAWTGSFTNNGGPVWINNSASLGSGAKTIYIANNLVGAGLHLNGTNGNINLAGPLQFIVSQNQGAIFNEAGDNVINGNMYVFSGGGFAYILANAGSLTLNGTIGLSTSARPFMVGGAGNGTINGPVTAALPLTKTDAGTWTLTGHNTYTGATTIQGGTLALATNATINSTPVISILSNAVFDVTLLTNTTYNANAFYLTPGGTVQTLAGNGTVNGNLNAASTAYITPGGTNSIGTLTISKTLALSSATAQFELNTGITPGNGVNDLINIGGDFDPTAGTAFITALSPLTSPGTYRLFNYSGAELNPASYISVQTDTRYTLTLDDSVANQVNVLVSGNNSSLIWSGGAGAAWDLVDSPNWDADSDYFYNADTVTFDDSSANNLVTVSAAVRPLSVTVSNNAVNYNFIGFGKITGLTGLTKAGSGLLAITYTNNDFTGPVVVNGGTLLVTNFFSSGNPSPLGAGTSITLNGGTFAFGGPRPASGSVNRTWTLGANGGTILSTNATFFLANQISGPGSLTKTGSVQVILGDIVTGVLSANASNSYSGNTYITQGELQIRNPHALGLGKAVVSTGADLAVGGGVNYGAFTNNIDLNGGDGNGNNGTLQVNDANSQAIFSGTINLLASSSVGTVNNGSVVTFTISGPVIGPGALKKLGTNTVSLTCATNTYGGGTLVSSGTLQLGAGSTAGSPGSGPVTNNAALAYNHTDTRTNGAVISGTGSLTHKGAGTLVLTGANTYSGVTTVSAGTLVVMGSLGASSAVTVANNATLGGTGTIGGPVTVSSGGTLALGAALGTLTINNTVSLSGTNVMKINKAGITLTHDTVQGVTTLNYGGVLKVTATGDALASGDSFKLFNATTYNGNFASTNLPALGTGLSWDTTGLTNGTIKVVGGLPPQPTITQFLQAGNNFQLKFSGASGFNYRVWASTNVAFSPVTSTWSNLSSGTFSAAPVTFTDTQAANFPRRFYLITIP